MRMKIQILRLSVKFFALYFLLISLTGCDAFVRKFTRKKKKTQMPQEEVVLVPEEYRPTMSKEEVYRKYFLFWESWHDELLQALLQNSSHKKQVSCMTQVLKNLGQLRQLLNADMQVKLDVYINQLKNLQDVIGKDVYGQSALTSRSAAERLKIRIQKEFNYSKVKDSLL